MNNLYLKRTKPCDVQNLKGDKEKWAALVAFKASKSCSDKPAARAGVPSCQARSGKRGAV